MDSNIKVLYRRCSVRLVVRRSPSLGGFRVYKKKKKKYTKNEKKKEKEENVARIQRKSGQHDGRACPSIVIRPAAMLRRDFATKRAERHVRNTITNPSSSLFSSWWSFGRNLRIIVLRARKAMPHHYNRSFSNLMDNQFDAQANSYFLMSKTLANGNNGKIGQRYKVKETAGATSYPGN